MNVALVLAYGKAAGGLTALGVLALILAIVGLYYVLRDDGLTGGAKALWIALVLFFPILGPAVYFAVRSDW
jgi:hypothetical protein